jgi:hypothetical protein
MLYEFSKYKEYSSNIESQIIMDQHGYFKTNFTQDQFEVPVSHEEMEKYNKFWAPNDYVNQVDDTVFEIFTNFGIANATLKTCAEDPQYESVICNINNNTVCRKGKQSPNGIQTGACVKMDLPEKHITNRSRWYVCEVEGWCPVAQWPPLNNSAVLLQTKNTILSIRNFIQFPDYDKKTETKHSGSPECLYDQFENKHCPYLKLGDIVKHAKSNTDSYEFIATYTGAIFEIRLDWDCKSEMIDQCEPDFSFSRRDNQNSQSLWSFWKYEKLNSYQRILTYGMKIKFYVLTYGRISRNSIYNLALEIAAYSGVFTLVLILFKITLKFFEGDQNGGEYVFCKSCLKVKDFLLCKKN